MRYLLTIAMKQVARQVNSLLSIWNTSRSNVSESLTDLNNGHYYFFCFKRVLVTKAFSKDNILIATDCQRFSGICYLPKKDNSRTALGKNKHKTTCLNRK